MINPNVVQVMYQKLQSRATGEKFYRAGFDIGKSAKYSRKHFRTAVGAQDYGQRVVARWMRLYDAAIVALMPEREPSA